MKDGDFYTLEEVREMLSMKPLSKKPNSTRRPKRPKSPMRPSCKSCGAYMAWGTARKPKCPFCDGGVEG